MNLKPATPPPWHLIACILLPIISLIFVHLTPDSLRPYAVILGLILVILVPGYLLALLLFPGSSDLDLPRRALFCLAFSLAIAILIGLILTFTPRGLEFESLATILSMLCFLLAPVAYMRWSALPRRKRFTIAADSGFRSAGSVSRSSKPKPKPKSRSRTKSRAVYLLAVLVAISAVAALAYAINMQRGSNEQGYTEFHASLMKGEDGSDFSSLQAGTTLTALAEIINHEGRDINYTLRLAAGDAILFSENMLLGNNESWKGPVDCAIDKTGSHQKLDLLLFKDGDFSEPYLEDHIWVDVMEKEGGNESASLQVGNSSLSASSAKTAAATNEQKAATSTVSTAAASTPKSSTPASSSSASASSQSSATKSASGTAKSSKSTTASSSAAASSPASSSPASSSSASPVSVSSTTTSSTITSSTAKPSTTTSSTATATKAASTSAPSASSGQTSSTAANASSAKESQETAASSPAQTSPASSTAAASSTSSVSPITPASSSPSTASSLGNASSASPSSSSNKSSQSNQSLQSIQSSPSATTASLVSTPANEPSNMPTNETPKGSTNELSTAAKSPASAKASAKVSRDAGGNQPPTLKDLHADKSSPMVPGATVVWTANATDPEYDQVQYKFLLNAEPVTVWSKFNSWSWTTKGLTPGDYTITVQAKDGKHLPKDSPDSSLNATFTLASPNRIPVLLSLAADPAGPREKGTSITWKAQANDTDGDLIYYRFFLNDREATSWSPTNSWVWDTSSLDPGDYRISVVAKDGKHASGDNFDSSKAGTFTILPPAPTPPPNRPPTLTSLQPSPASPQSSGERITWTANATDPDGDPISYRFLLDGKELTDWSGSSTWIWDTATENVGDYIVLVQVRDDRHASGDSFDDAENSSFRLLAPNRPPVLESLTPDKASPQSRETTIFWKAKADDPDGDRILYKFFLDGKAMTRWTKSNSWSWATGDLPAGEYEIRVLARDAKHADENSQDSSMNATFVLSAPNKNQSPVLKTLDADRASPQSRGSHIAWTATARDDEGDPLSYKFLLDDKDMTGWTASNTWTWDSSSAATGDHKIRVLVRDGKHGSEDSYDGAMTKSFALTASSNLPVLQSLQSDPESPQNTGTSITWTARASDTDGDPVSYKFLLDDRDMTIWTASNTWTWDSSSAAPGEHRIKALVRDGKHASEDSYDDSKAADFTLQSSNQLPTPVSLTPDKTSPQTQGVTITWKAEASDPEGDPVQYRFLQDGKAMTGWSESNSWIWSTAEVPASKYRIQVQIRDGKHAPENSFDRSVEQSFTLISEIDQQIEQLMKKRSSDAKSKEGYQSQDIKVSEETASGENSTKEHAVLGKSAPEQDAGKSTEPRKLG